MKSNSCRCVGLFLRSLYYPTTSYIFFTTPPCLGLLSFCTHGLGWTEKLICSFSSQSLVLTSLSMTWLFYVASGHSSHFFLVFFQSFLSMVLRTFRFQSRNGVWVVYLVGCCCYFPCFPWTLKQKLRIERECHLEVLLMVLTIQQRSVLSSRNKNDLKGILK